MYVMYKLKPQAAQAEGGLGSSCCITQDYKEMYWDFNDLGKSNDLIMKLEINVLYLYIVVSCVYPSQSSFCRLPIKLPLLSSTNGNVAFRATVGLLQNVTGLSASSTRPR